MPAAGWFIRAMPCAPNHQAPAYAAPRSAVLRAMLPQVGRNASHPVPRHRGPAAGVRLPVRADDFFP